MTVSEQSDELHTADTRKATVDDMQSEIIRRICFREYPPGTQLKEAELAAEFGVSRTPVRDAISRIKHLGLVETRNGVGTVVVELSAETIRHVYEIRLHMATLIGVMSPAPIEEGTCALARALLADAIDLQADFSPRRYVELNHHLHNLVAGLIGNSLLQSFWRQSYYLAASTWYRIASIVGDDAAAGFVLELNDLVTALEQNDLAAFGYLQRVHIGYGFERIREHLLEDADHPAPRNP